MEIYLIRHTKPKIEEGICYGQLDIDLAETQNIEIENILSKLPLNIELVYSSPLKRCKILAENINSKVLFDERLMELNFGDWEGKKWDDIDQNKLNIWMNDYVNVKVENGESYLDLFDRAQLFWNEKIVNSNDNFNKIAIVTHAGFIRAILSFIQNSKLEDSFQIKLDYGNISKITIQNKSTEINNINE